MSLYWWKTSDRAAGSRRSFGTPGMSSDYVPPAYPAGSGFWANHRLELALCLLCEAVCVGVVIFGWRELLLLGVSSVLYFAFLTFGMVACPILPIHWALRHRRMVRASDTTDDEKDLADV